MQILFIEKSGNFRYIDIEKKLPKITIPSMEIPASINFSGDVVNDLLDILGIGSNKVFQCFTFTDGTFFYWEI